MLLVHTIRYQRIKVNFRQHETTLLIKVTAKQNEVALSYHKLRGLYFLAGGFVATILTINIEHLL